MPACCGSRSIARLLRRLDLALGETDGVGDVAGVLGIGAIVFAGRATLVPVGLTERSTAVERAVAAAAGGIAEEAAIGLDLSTLDVVIHGGLIGPLGVAPMIDDLVVPPGRYPISSVVWSENLVALDDRRAHGVARLAELICRPASLDAGTFLQRLDQLSKHIADETVPARGSDVGVVLATLS